MGSHNRYHPKIITDLNLDFVAVRHHPEGIPRPREASFIPDGIRKDIKIKMRKKLS